MLSKAAMFAIFILLVSWGISLTANYIRGARPVYAANRSQLQDAESLLAQGKKLTVGCLGQGTLQLVPGISDRLASNILAKLPAVLSKPQGLELVHGIGSKTEQKLRKYLIVKPCGIKEDRFDEKLLNASPKLVFRAKKKKQSKAKTKKVLPLGGKAGEAARRKNFGIAS